MVKEFKDTVINMLINKLKLTFRRIFELKTRELRIGEREESREKAIEELRKKSKSILDEISIFYENLYLTDL